MTTDFKIRGINTRFHFMGNEASTALKMEMKTMYIKYQSPPPSNHRANNAERSIQTFKNYFIAGLLSVYKNFQLQLWEILLHQATISINLLRQSRIHPQLSAYMHIFGEFDYNHTLLVPRRTRVVIKNSTKYRTSWAPH